MEQEFLEKVFAILQTRLSQSPGFGSVIKINIESQGSLYVDGKQSPPIAYLEQDLSSELAPECTITAEAEVLRGLMLGNLNPMGAFMSGKLRIDGDLSVAMGLVKTFA